MSDDRKVHDLSMRRQERLQDDPVLQLASELTKVVAAAADGMPPANQLVAIELTARAVLETLRHARGEDALNEIIVEFQNKCRFYTMKWPDHDQSRTVYDTEEQDGEEPQAEIVPLSRPEPKE